MDFNYVDNDGLTIFKMCFDRYIHAYFTLKKSDAELSKMVGEIENVFFWLIGEAQKRHTEQEIKTILEKNHQLRRCRNIDCKYNVGKNFDETPPMECQNQQC